MAGDANDVPQIKKLEELESLLAHHIQTHVYLQPNAVAGNVRESGFAMRAQCDDAASHAHFHAPGAELLGCPLAKLRGNLSCRMRPGKLVRVGRIPKGFDFSQLFAALKKLVERFKFQRDNPFDTLAV